MLISIVLPCSNEIEAIPQVMGDLLLTQRNMQKIGYRSEIIVFDDASEDGSSEELRKFDSVKLISAPSSVGYGGALKQAFLAAQGEYVVFLDMDGTYPPEKIADLVGEVLRTKSDMVFGVRKFFDSDMPWSRGLGNGFYKMLTSVLLGSEIRDLCTGMRVIHRNRIPEIAQIPANGLHFSMKLSLLALENRWRVSEIEIPYYKRIGVSKLNLVVDGVNFLWEILRTKWLWLKTS